MKGGYTDFCIHLLSVNSASFFHALHTVLKVIDFPRYNIKCSGENVILRGMLHVVIVGHTSASSASSASSANS